MSRNTACVWREHMIWQAVFVTQENHTRFHRLCKALIHEPNLCSYNTPELHHAGLVPNIATL